MEAVKELSAVFLTLLGLSGVVVTLLVWRFVIPKEIQKQSRDEMKYYEERLSAKDKLLAELRLQREADLIRLSRDEAQFDRLKDRFEKLAVWRLGAEGYMRAMEIILQRQGLEMPNRREFGVNGEE